MFDLFFISFYYHNRISNHNIKKKILTWSQSYGIFSPLSIVSVVVLDGWNCDRESPITSGPGVGTKEGRDWHSIISFEGTFPSGLS